jgi:hypothetical protein
LSRLPIVLSKFTPQDRTKHDVEDHLDFALADFNPRSRGYDCQLIRDHLFPGGFIGQTGAHQPIDFAYGALTFTF